MVGNWYIFPFLLENSGLYKVLYAGNLNTGSITSTTIFKCSDLTIYFHFKGLCCSRAFFKCLFVLVMIFCLAVRLSVLLDRTMRRWQAITLVVSVTLKPAGNLWKFCSGSRRLKTKLCVSADVHIFNALLIAAPDLRDKYNERWDLLAVRLFSYQHIIRPACNNSCSSLFKDLNAQDLHFQVNSGWIPKM